MSILARVKLQGAVKETLAKEARTSKTPKASAKRSNTGAYVAATASAFPTNCVDCWSYFVHASR